MRKRLVLKDGRMTVKTDTLKQLGLFQNHPELLEGDLYEVKTPAGREEMDEIVAKLEDPDFVVNFADINIQVMKALCKELGFSGFDDQFKMYEGTSGDTQIRQEVAEFREAVDDLDMKMEVMECQYSRIEQKVLELADQSKIQACLQQISAIESKVSALEAENARLSSQVKALTPLQARVVALEQENKALSARLQTAHEIHKREIKQRFDALAVSLKTSLTDSRAINDIQRDLRNVELRQRYLEQNVTDTINMKLRSADNNSMLCQMKERIRGMDESLKNLMAELPPALEGKATKESLESLAKRVQCLEGAAVDIEPRTHEKRTFEFNRDFNGVIAYLTGMCGGNVHKKGIVKITSSGCKPNFPPECVADLETPSYYYSTDLLDTWICYDFQERSLAPTYYSIRSYGGGKGGFDLKSWVLEGSRDGKQWVSLDKRNNNDSLNGWHAEGSFEIAQRVTALGATMASYRFIRLKQTGPNHRGNGIVEICAFELFGVLTEPGN